MLSSQRYSSHRKGKKAAPEFTVNGMKMLVTVKSCIRGLDNITIPLRTKSGQEEYFVAVYFTSKLIPGLKDRNG